jgi:hypothetical protein
MKAVLTGKHACCLVFAISLVGCGAVGTVEGTVRSKANGKKVVWGTVVITGSDKVARPGTIDSEGKYSIPGVPAGPASITVSSPDPSGVSQPKRSGAEGKAKRGEGGPRAPSAVPETVPPDVLKAWFAIPEHYGDPGKSPLKVTVKGGLNPHDIDLE